jgi:hypothetical protein
MPINNLRLCPFCGADSSPDIYVCQYCGQDLDKAVQYPTDNNQGWSWSPRDKPTEPGMYARRNTMGGIRTGAGSDDRRSALSGECLSPADQVILDEIMKDLKGGYHARRL